MEIQSRRHNMIQDQENVYVGKGKSSAALPVKRQVVGLRTRVLGDVNTNVQAQRDANPGKVAVAAAEFEKKVNQSRVPLRSNYTHVQSKVDTGLVGKTVQPAARPPLRREESTAGLATRAATQARTILKENQSKAAKPKESSNTLLQAKKSSQEFKKLGKLPSVKEQVKRKENVLQPIIKDPVESLGKLKLADTKYERNYMPISPAIKLPKDIEDIDAADKKNPYLMSIYIKDIYKYLTELEIKYPIEPDHLKIQSVITGKMRATLIDWLVEVQHQFSLVLETFHLTVGILDRYLQAVPNVQRERLQLIGVTAMYLASKYEEIYAPDVGDFVYVTDNAYTKADVFQCERDILSKLGFCLARPIPLSFLRRFVKAAHGTSKHHHLAKYLVDLCLVEYTMAHYRPSELAAAAICLSLHLLSNKPLIEVWTPTLSYYSKYTLKHIEPIIRKIAKIVLNVGNSKCQAVYNKYLDLSVAKVAGLPHLKGEAIRELAEDF